MYCKHCGSELDEDGFCSECGILYENKHNIIYNNTYIEPEKKTSGIAVASFVLAVLAFFLGGEITVILYFISLIFAFFGISHTKRGAKRGRGFAVIALLLDLVPFIFGFIIGLLRAI